MSKTINIVKPLLSALFLLICALPGSLYAGWIPFNLKNGHITVDIKFNGVESTAILDTGAEINAVSTLYVDKYNEGIEKARMINVKGVNGVMKRQTYRNIPITIFGADVVLNNLVESGLGGNAILLGAPFFRNLIVQIDYPNSRLQVFPKKAIDLDKHENLDIRRDKSSTLPTVKVTIDGVNVWLTLDTGSNGGILVKREFAKRMKWVDEDTETVDGSMRGVNSSSYTETFNIPELQFGPYGLENIPITIPAEGESVTIGEKYRGIYRSSFSKDSKGLLGYDILKHFILTIDYSSYKAHIVAP
jgi:predicted aspartyl protease